MNEREVRTELARDPDRLGGTSRMAVDEHDICVFHSRSFQQGVSPTTGQTPTRHGDRQGIYAGECCTKQELDFRNWGEAVECIALVTICRMRTRWWKGDDRNE